jgi:hypothetical protein
MRNVVLWKQVFLGASLFLCGTSPVMATEVGDLVPDVRGNALQQDGRRVTCTISDKAGPIVGANVLIKGTTIGNISDMDGRVILDGVPDNTILVVSYIGYVTQEISLKNSQNNIKVKLAEDTQALDEVVVVGYGTQAKKDYGICRCRIYGRVEGDSGSDILRSLARKGFRCVYLELGWT